MMHSNEITLKPAMIFAFFKAMPFITVAIISLSLAWCLSPFFILFSLVLTGMGWYRFLYIRNSRYIVTNEMIQISRGIFFKRTDRLEMFRIKDYIITQPLLFQWLHLMNLILKGTDPKNPVIWLRGIPESDIVDTISNYVNEARRHNQIYEIN